MSEQTIASPSGEGCVLLSTRRPKYSPPDKYRDVEKIDPQLRKTIRSVVGGLQPWPLVLLGQQGAGKTCAGLCLIDCFGGWYVPLPDLCRMLVAAQKGELQWSSGHKRTEGEIWEAIRSSNLIVLDELGQRSKVTDFHYETAKRVLDDREGKPLTVISNLSVSAIADVYDNRIASRLSGGTIFKLCGDRRLGRCAQEV